MHTLPLPPRECRTTDRRPRVNEPAQQHGYGQPTGRWYYVITWVSLGLLAAVPFFHAAAHLNRPALHKTGAGFAAASVVGMVLIGIAPTDEAGDPTGWLSNVGAVLLLAVMILATTQHVGLRREVYPRPGVPRPVDPNRDAVAGIETARAKRTEARLLAERDPMMARELRIGRPDLRREYDDGGLVDLNAAPIETLAREFELSEQAARSLAEVRERIGRLDNVEEVITFGDIPEGSAQLMRERGIVIAEPRF